MLPFCGYNMGDYFRHWLDIGAGADAAKLPQIFYVNWFRRDQKGRYLWPGYSENSRVLKWIFDRCDGKVHAADTPIGRLPEPADLDTSGLDISSADLARLLSIDVDGWLTEIPLIRQHFAQFGDHLPAELKQEVAELERRLKAQKN
jgi:phosphoenolpyruvate carboxykinase (GTP)